MYTCLLTRLCIGVGDIPQRVLRVTATHLSLPSRERLVTTATRCRLSTVTWPPPAGVYHNAPDRDDPEHQRSHHAGYQHCDDRVRVVDVVEESDGGVPFAYLNLGEEGILE